MLLYPSSGLHHRSKYPMISQTITTPQGNQHCANPSSVKSLPRLPIDPDVTLTSRHLAQRLLIGQEIVLVTWGVLMLERSQDIWTLGWTHSNQIGKCTYITCVFYENTIDIHLCRIFVFKSVDFYFSPFSWQTLSFVLFLFFFCHTNGMENKCIKHLFKLLRMLLL